MTPRRLSLAAVMPVLVSAAIGGEPDYPARGSVELVDRPPVASRPLDGRTTLFDFGTVAFGNLELALPRDSAAEVIVRFGEVLDGDRVDRDPGASIYSAEVRAEVPAGESVVVEPLTSWQNTQQGEPPSVLTPPEWGAVAPFRWVEVEGAADPVVIQRAAFVRDWDDDAASFACSDETLNRVWELCRYSIKATTFAGVYIDGNRERVPYEADAYLNQQSHHYVEGDVTMARRTFDWLMRHPTWPTEWAPHLVLMAHADWRHSGDLDWLRTRYPLLAAKTLSDRVGPSGWVESSPQQVRRGDLVDWPAGERDGFVMGPINTVVNAFHYAASERMAELAQAIGAEEEARRYADRVAWVRDRFHDAFYDPAAARYRDGIGVEHHAHHATFFPLAFGLVPEAERSVLAERLAEEGMRCSVYGAQYFLQALFENGAGRDAVRLVVAPGDRSWRRMLDQGATITWEAWDRKHKPNLDYNHAWGAAPANLLPRHVLGVDPLEPGWRRAAIEPLTCGLAHARGMVPTPHGPIEVRWTAEPRFELQVAVPEGVRASVSVPAPELTAQATVDGVPVAAKRDGDRLRLVDDLTGRRRVVVE